jgi:cytidylate kinase
VHSIESLIGRQMERWEKEHGTWLPSAEDPDAEFRNPRPVIAISPELGCGSRLVTEMLSRRTGYDLYGFKLIDKVAENMNVRRQLVDRLDQRLRSYIRNLIDGILSGGRHIEQSEYFENLTQVLGVFIAEGGVILLGRGAAHMVPKGAGVRVRLVAPPEQRIVNLMRYYKINAREAEERMLTSDSEREAFHHKYYGKNWRDAENYDLTINMDRVGAETATSLILRSLDEVLRGSDSPRKNPRGFDEEPELILDRQIKRWDAQSRHALHEMRDDLAGADASETCLPVAAFQSRFCSGTRLVCEVLQETLGYQTFGYRLIASIAEDMNLSPLIIDRLDQRAKSSLANIIEDFRTGSKVNREDYHSALVRVIRALIIQGGVNLIGRGAPYLVEKKEGLRIHTTAPWARRLETMKGFYDIEGTEAESQLRKSDEERAEFAERVFKVDWLDTRNYDLSFNMDRLSPRGVVSLIERAMEPLYD